MIKIKKQIVFLGKPGAGKGTIAAEISKRYGIIHISTGNIFRDEIASKSDLGIKVSKIVESGQYVPDEITNEIVRKKIVEMINNKKIFMLDGYPRTEEQAKFLDNIKGLEYDVIMLDVPQDIIIERLSGRRQCLNCKLNYHIKFNPPKLENICDICQTPLTTRKDDSAESIKTRLKVYEEQTQPVIDYYQNSNRVHLFDGSGKVEDIVDNIVRDLY